MGSNSSLGEMGDEADRVQLTSEQIGHCAVQISSSPLARSLRDSVSGDYSSFSRFLPFFAGNLHLANIRDLEMSEYVISDSYLSGKLQNPRTIQTEV